MVKLLVLLDCSRRQALGERSREDDLQGELDARWIADRMLGPVDDHLRDFGRRWSLEESSIRGARRAPIIPKGFPSQSVASPKSSIVLCARAARSRRVERAPASR